MLMPSPKLYIFLNSFPFNMLLEFVAFKIISNMVQEFELNLIPTTLFFFSIITIQFILIYCNILRFFFERIINGYVIALRKKK